MFDTTWLIDQQDQLCSSLTDTRKEYYIPDLSGFVPSPKNDPFFWIRQGIRPDLHRKIYPNIPFSLDPKKKKESKKMELKVFGSNDPYYHLRKIMDSALHKQYYGE